MSLDGALEAATSALQAQAKALSIISDNLANSSTTGYKAVDVTFAALVSGESTSTSDTTGGVTASAVQDINALGLISSTDASTNMAIDGNGLFVVSDGLGGQIYYTRDGAFSTDAAGYLTVNGYYLMGWPTNSSGDITATDDNTTSGLEAINVDEYSTSAEATQNVTLSANLPADATAGFTTVTSLEAYDSLGEEQDIPVTWTKTSTDNEWTMTVGNPVSASSDDQSGTVAGVTSYTIDFNSNGTLGSISYDSSGTTTTVSTATITIGSWNDGANTTTDGNISLDLGTAGSADGLTQYASDETTPTVDIKGESQDGLAYGTLDSVSVSSNGTVTATYSNGEEIPIFKVALATFENVDGLAANSDGVYEETTDSGTYTLNVAGTGGTGTIEGSALEGSTVDTSTQFSQMIVAQQAYSAASQIVSTDRSMFDALMQAMT
jgi:flagellar hook protein FlgE